MDLCATCCRDLSPITQLYVSVDAATRDSLKAIDRPLFKDFWERFLECLRLLRDKRQRTVYRSPSPITASAWLALLQCFTRMQCCRDLLLSAPCAHLRTGESAARCLGYSCHCPTPHISKCAAS